MVELQIPELINSYLTFCNYRAISIASKRLDLSWCNWMYPTTLIPLSLFIKDKSILYLPPLNPNVSNYINLLTGKLKHKDIENPSFIPFVFLPKSKNNSFHILKKIFDLQNNGDDYGGQNAFRYLVNELVDNIYEHSKFNNAIVMAQRYDKKGFVDICFYDDGITIPQSFEDNNLNFSDSEAISQALNGFSTKSKERGFGLSSNLKIFVKGLNGKILIVSRNGLVYFENDNPKIYKLNEQNKLMGTLITLRIPIPSKNVNIYEYLK